MLRGTKRTTSCFDGSAPKTCDRVDQSSHCCVRVTLHQSPHLSGGQHVLRYCSRARRLDSLILEPRRLAPAQRLHVGDSLQLPRPASDAMKAAPVVLRCCGATNAKRLQSLLTPRKRFCMTDHSAARQGDSPRRRTAGRGRCPRRRLPRRRQPPASCERHTLVHTRQPCECRRVSCTPSSGCRAGRVGAAIAKVCAQSRNGGDAQQANRWQSEWR